jgi:hypothetical protein
MQSLFTLFPCISRCCFEEKMLHWRDDLINFLLILYPVYVPFCLQNCDQLKYIKDLFSFVCNVIEVG